MDTTTAPAHIKSWLECAAWILGSIFLAIQTWKALHKQGKPSNELLGESAIDLKERIKPLETHIHADYERRIGEHEGQIAQLWNTVREEDKAIRREMADADAATLTEFRQAFADIERALGRIEGKLDK